MTPTAGVERVRFGRDIDDALHCVDANYEGPDGLPLPAMLAGAVRELVRLLPGIRATIEADQVVVSAGSRTVAVRPVANIEELTLALVRLAEFGRAVVPGTRLAQTGSPEHVLLQGALGALAWRTAFIPPRGTPSHRLR